jgi:hypothetical protein
VKVRCEWEIGNLNAGFSNTILDHRKRDSASLYLEIFVRWSRIRMFDSHLLDGSRESARKAVNRDAMVEHPVELIDRIGCDSAAGRAYRRVGGPSRHTGGTPTRA